MGVLLPLIDSNLSSDDTVFYLTVLIDDGPVTEERALDVTDRPHSDIIHYDTVGQPDLGLNHAISPNGAVFYGRLVRDYGAVADEALGPDVCLGIDFAVRVEVGVDLSGCLEEGGDPLRHPHVEVNQVVDGIGPYADAAVCDVGVAAQDPVLIVWLQITGTKVPAGQVLSQYVRLIHLPKILADSTFIKCYALGIRGLGALGSNIDVIIAGPPGLFAKLLVDQIRQNFTPNGTESVVSGDDITDPLVENVKVGIQ